MKKDASATIRDAAMVVRSKNAGPFILTFDILFKDKETFARVQKAERLTRAAVAKAYNVSANEILDFEFHAFANAVKFSIRRPIASGSVGDSDVYGSQQHAPLLALEAF